MSSPARTPPNSSNADNAIVRRFHALTSMLEEEGHLEPEGSEKVIALAAHYAGSVPRDNLVEEFRALGEELWAMNGLGTPVATHMLVKVAQAEADLTASNA